MKRFLLTYGLVGLLSTGLVAQGTLSNQVLQLLSRINTWTNTNTFQDIRVYQTAVPSDTASRLYADVAGNLYYNGGLIAGSGGGVTPHNFLSTTHPDTLTGSPTRGAVVVGNSTPKWSTLTVCASGSYIGSDGTDTGCRTSAAGFTAIPAAQISGTAAAFVGTAITALNATNLGSGTVPLARLAGITNTEISASAAIAYTKLVLTGGIVNADVSGSAAIAYSKLNLASSIVTGDIANATILFADWASNSCTNLQVAQYNGSAWVCKTLVTSDVSGAGTVSSVAFTIPAIFSVSGSPVTTTGTIALTLATQTANTIWAGPTTGAAASPTFRAMVVADLPTITSGQVNNTIALTGTDINTSNQVTVTHLAAALPMAQGGTGVAVSADDTVLIGSGAAWVARTMPDCTTGALNYTQATNLFSCNAAGATHDILSLTHSDTLAAAVVRGAMMVGNSTPKWARVAVGTVGQFWTSDGTDPSWTSTLARGIVTSSTPWTLTQTLNSGGTTFRVLDVTVTDTASAAASTLFRLIAGAGGTTTEFSVTTTGTLFAAGNLTGTAGTSTLGTNAVPYATNYLGTAATNNLAITPAAFAQATIATVDDPGLAAVKLALVRRGTIAYTSGALNTGTCSAAVTATVTGLATTSTIAVSHNAAPGAVWQQGIYFLAYPTANTVNVIVCNPTAGTLSPNNATFNYTAVVP